MTQPLTVSIHFSAAPVEDGIKVHASFTISDPTNPDEEKVRQSFTGGESILVPIDEARAVNEIDPKAPYVKLTIGLDSEAVEPVPEAPRVVDND